MKLEGEKLPKEKLGAFFGIVNEMNASQEKGIFGQCMYSLDGCQEPPIASHLLAESWLRTIADETNHVIAFDIMTSGLAKDGARIEPQRVGVAEKSAVTFPGFCRKHDSELFSCLETAEFTATPAQLVALTYRSVCREACAKYQMVKCNLPRVLSKWPRSSYSQFAAQELKKCIRLLARKQELEKSLLVPDNDIAAYIVEFASHPTMLVSATVPISVTFTGRPLDSGRNDWTTFSILPSQKGGYAVFTWSKRASKNPARLVKSFIGLNRELQSSALIHLALEISENVAIAPAWWAKLTVAQQDDLLWRFARNLNSDGSTKPMPSLYPKPPGIVDWRIASASYV